MRSFVHFRLVGIAIGLVVCAESIAGPSVLERSASLASLFPTEQVDSFATILPADHIVRWHVVVPEATQLAGALVFVSPGRSGAPPETWIEVLKRRNLIFVGAENFGNTKPTAQRILAAMMGLALVQREFRIDPKRSYIAGMSGGGRVASRAITSLPQLFSGAVYIVGVDPWTTQDQALLTQLITKRYVFITGSKDFNRRETRQVYESYRLAGAPALLIDVPGQGHRNASAAQLDEALAFLDGTSRMAE